MLELLFMVGIKVCRFQDVIVVLRNEGEMNLFAVFPIGATIQDGGERKMQTCVTTVIYLFIIQEIGKNRKEKSK